MLEKTKKFFLITNILLNMGIVSSTPNTKASEHAGQLYSLMSTKMKNRLPMKYTKICGEKNAFESSLKSYEETRSFVPLSSTVKLGVSSKVDHALYSMFKQLSRIIKEKKINANLKNLLDFYRFTLEKAELDEENKSLATVLFKRTMANLNTILGEDDKSKAVFTKQLEKLTTGIQKASVLVENLCQELQKVQTKNKKDFFQNQDTLKACQELHSIYANGFVQPLTNLTFSINSLFISKSSDKSTVSDKEPYLQILINIALLQEIYEPLMLAGKLLNEEAFPQTGLHSIAELVSKKMETGQKNVCKSVVEDIVTNVDNHLEKKTNPKLTVLIKKYSTNILEMILKSNYIMNKSKKSCLEELFRYDLLLDSCKQDLFQKRIFNEQSFSSDPVEFNKMIEEKTNLKKAVTVNHSEDKPDSDYKPDEDVDRFLETTLRLISKNAKNKANENAVTNFLSFCELIIKKSSSANQRNSILSLLADLLKDKFPQILREDDPEKDKKIKIFTENLNRLVICINSIVKESLVLQEAIRKAESKIKENTEDKAKAVWKTRQVSNANTKINLLVDECYQAMAHIYFSIYRDFKERSEMDGEPDIQVYIDALLYLNLIESIYRPVLLHNNILEKADVPRVLFFTITVLIKQNSVLFKEEEEVIERVLVRLSEVTGNYFSGQPAKNATEFFTDYMPIVYNGLFHLCLGEERAPEDITDAKANESQKKRLLEEAEKISQIAQILEKTRDLSSLKNHVDSILKIPFQVKPKDSKKSLVLRIIAGSLLAFNVLLIAMHYKMKSKKVF